MYLSCRVASHLTNFWYRSIINLEYLFLMSCLHILLISMMKIDQDFLLRWHIFFLLNNFNVCILYFHVKFNIWSFRNLRSDPIFCWKWKGNGFWKWKREWILSKEYAHFQNKSSCLSGLSILECDWLLNSDIWLIFHFSPCDWLCIYCWTNGT